MAVPIQYLNVIVRKSTLESLYPGGVEAYREACPNGTYEADEWLTRVGFMNPGELDWFVNELESKGLRLWNSDGCTFGDIAIVDTLGAPTRCDWLQWHHPDRFVFSCSLKGSGRGARVPNI
jgi:hypothetical protein